MILLLFFVTAVEITGPDVAACTSTVKQLFAAMDERAKAIEDETRPATRINRTFNEQRGGGTRVEKYNEDIRNLRAQLDEQQCTVKFVQREASDGPPE